LVLLHHAALALWRLLWRLLSARGLIVGHALR
jgi:hypothetical protein